MESLFFRLGAVGLLILLFAFILVVILLPFSAYAAQKWAYRTYQETKKLNEKLSEIAILFRESQSQPKATPKKEVTRAEMYTKAQQNMKKQS